jgi:nicotinate phosphoribosyltransferase
MAHSYVMAFPDELSAFRAYSRQFPDAATLLLDTYSYEQGLKNALQVARELRDTGHLLQGVRLDSGNLAAVSRRVRQALNKQGFSGVRIVASGDLDEYKISRLQQQRAPIDSFGVGTHMGVSSDAPFCNVIYKLSEIEDSAGRFQPVMKLSESKHTVPGRKQVFRRQDRSGNYQGDVICRADEKSAGIALLHPAMRNGTIIGKAYSLRQTREYIREQVAALPSSVKKLRQAGVYSVVKSRRLQRLMQTVCRRMKIGRTRCV